MFRSNILLLLLLCGFVPKRLQANEEMNSLIIDRNNPEISSVLSRLETFLDSIYQETHLVGMSVVVIYDQNILWSRGFGYANIESKILANEKTIYDISSVTKIFTATMLMHLRDAGRVHLDDPLLKYLPEFHLKSRFPDPKPPTFKQVVAHVAGLPRESAALVTEGNMAFPSTDAMLENLKDMEMILPAFTDVKYSNLGYALMGLALGRAAGQTFKEYVVENILQPLGMKNSGWELTDVMKSRMAVGYEPLQSDQTRGIALHYELGEAGAPTGGFYTSVEDMSRFVSLQFREGPAGGTQILGSTTLREMRSPVFLLNNWEGAVGIGWWLSRVAGYDVVDHGGGGPGFVAKVLLVPKLKLGFVIFINQMADQHSISHKALQLLIPVFSKLYANRSVKSLPPEASSYVGRYTMQEGITIDVIIRDEQLIMVQLHEGKKVDEWQLILEKGHRYRMQGGPLNGEVAMFEVDSKGQVIRIDAGGYIVHPIDKKD